MKKIIELQKSKFGLKYRTDRKCAWLYFPDNIETREQMMSFFKSGKHLGTSGTFNDVDLIFVSDDNQRAKYYKVIDRSNGRVTCKVDGEKTLHLEPEQFPEGLTDERIKELCQAHARKFHDLPATVEL